MTKLRNVDLSDVPDEDLTPEQKSELTRRFKAFFGPALKARTKTKKVKSPSPEKKIRKWQPGMK